MTRHKVTIKSSVEISLTGDDLIEILKSSGVIPENTAAEVTFKVPSGGDWSHMIVDVNEDNPVKITFRQVAYEQ